MLVLHGQEWAGIFIHDADRCWFGYKSAEDGQMRTAICNDHDEAVRKVEALMDAGLIMPRRRARV